MSQGTWTQPSLLENPCLSAPVVVRRQRSIRDGRKRCRGCDEWKSVEEFDRASRTTRNAELRSECRPCRRASSRSYHRSDRARDAWYRRTYGVTLWWYDTTLEAQGGLCVVCLRPPDPSYRPHPRLVVDHDHVTGKVRGLLCHRCNTAIGMIGDDVARLEGLIVYLDRPESSAA